MDPLTLTALRGSISKWEDIVAGTGEDLGFANCPLCKLFFFTIPHCFGCPVMEKTGMTGCGGTPYDDISELSELDSNEYHDAAIRELEFLRSLLPCSAGS